MNLIIHINHRFVCKQEDKIHVNDIEEKFETLITRFGFQPKLLIERTNTGNVDDRYPNLCVEIVTRKTFSQVALTTRKSLLTFML